MVPATLCPPAATVDPWHRPEAFSLDAVGAKGRLRDA
ncbi:hypothetical protein ABIB44_003498 [Hymenobacter sp. UYCo722]